MRTPVALALFLTLLFLPQFLFAQRFVTISGKLISAKDNTPVIYANLYIPNTSFGTYSDDQGNFSFQAQVWETFEMVISHVEHDITLLKLTAPGDQLDLQTIQLKLRTHTIQEVVVKADKNWKTYYEMFRKSFIGTTPNAPQCEITNRLVLNFDYDSTAQTLKAWAYEPLKIENKALGYELTYDLISFTIDHRKGTVFYQGFPFFKSLEAPKKRRQKRWDKEREEAYNGSVMHFIRSLHKGTLEAEGFTMKAQIRKEEFSGNMMMIQMTEPPISQEELLVKDTVEEALRLQTPHKLRIQYNGEKESAAYVRDRSMGLNGAPQPAKFQTSYIRLVADFVHIYSNGFINDGLDMVLEGYFGWEKVADMLPLDYKE